MKISYPYRASRIDPYAHVVEIPTEEFLQWRTLPQPPIDLGRAREVKRNKNYHITLTSVIVNRVLGALDCYPYKLTLEQFRELLAVCRPKHFGVGQIGLDHLRRVFLGSSDFPQTVERLAGWT